MRSSRFAWMAALLAAACGEAADRLPGPLDRVYRPTGLAVHRASDGGVRLVAVSSNADLLYDDELGGAVLSIDPDGAASTVGVNIRSFGGDLAVADPDVCGTAVPVPLAITATRGSNTLNVVELRPGGELACQRCGLPLAGPFSDPFAVTVACGGGRARAFVGYLRAPTGEAWISEYDLETGEVRSGAVGAGPVRAFAYDAARDRLYLLGLATEIATPLRWIELGGCRIDLPRGAGGCSLGEAALPSSAEGLELRSMALARDPAAPRRAFLTGRLYDPAAAALAGARTNDYGGVLLVVDLLEDALGGVDVRLAWEQELYGARGVQDVRLLPSRGPGRGELVAALAVEDGSVWIYDDETRELKAFGRDPDTGAPELGHGILGLAVDPEPVGTAARIYVGSFTDSFVTPVDVPLDAPGEASIVTDEAGLRRRITGEGP